MVIGPGLLTAHRLDAMHSHDGLQPPVMSLRTGDGLTGIMHHVAVVFDKTFHQFLIGHKDRSVLMTYGEDDRSRLILKGLEVFRTVGAVAALQGP